MTAATANYLSFNTTFTPACFGWGHLGEGAVLMNKQPDKEIQLVFYVGTAKGTNVVVDFGRQRKVFAQVVSGILGHVPPLVCKYSLGYGRTVALFLRADGYTYFAIADEALGRARGFEILDQVRVAFLDCMGGSQAPGGPHAGPGFEGDSGSGNVAGPGHQGFGAGYAERPHSESSLVVAKRLEGERARERGGEGEGEGEAETLGPRGQRGHGESGPDRGHGGRPSMVRSRSASQLAVLVSEAMESKFNEIVSQCRGRPSRKPKLEAQVYPDAPNAYLTSKKSVFEPDLLESPSLGSGGTGGKPGGSRGMSARESLMMEIAEALNDGESSRMSARENLMSEIAEVFDDGEMEQMSGRGSLMGGNGGRSHVCRMSQKTTARESYMNEIAEMMNEDSSVSRMSARESLMSEVAAALNEGGTPGDLGRVVQPKGVPGEDQRADESEAGVEANEALDRLGMMGMVAGDKWLTFGTGPTWAGPAVVSSRGPEVGESGSEGIFLSRTQTFFSQKFVAPLEYAEQEHYSGGILAPPMAFHEDGSVHSSTREGGEGGRGEAAAERGAGRARQSLRKLMRKSSPPFGDQMEERQSEMMGAKGTHQGTGSQRRLHHPSVAPLLRGAFSSIYRGSASMTSRIQQSFSMSYRSSEGEVPLARMNSGASSGADEQLPGNTPRGRRWGRLRGDTEEGIRGASADQNSQRFRLDEPGQGAVQVAGGAAPVGVRTVHQESASFSTGSVTTAIPAAHETGGTMQQGLLLSNEPPPADLYRRTRSGTPQRHQSISPAASAEGGGFPLRSASGGITGEPDVAPGMQRIGEQGQLSGRQLFGPLMRRGSDADAQGQMPTSGPGRRWRMALDRSRISRGEDFIMTSTPSLKDSPYSPKPP